MSEPAGSRGPPSTSEVKVGWWMVVDGELLLGQELREEDLLREAGELLEASTWDRWALRIT